MIANPPNITSLLRSHARLVSFRIHSGPMVASLAVLFQRHLGPMPWETFVHTYQLYLQSIPLDLAKQAWGLNAAQNQTAITKP